MEMKKLACAVIFAVASVSVVMANVLPAVSTQAGTTPEASPAITVTSTPAAAPGPSSGSAGLVPLVGATVLSFVACYMHF
ncbi:arabinogalactan protein 23-like [Prosopis cineraria]|uniref:arabinogalactan protein 23-like n=1 Tax=Prosopis cineraria TaxID=364024 RepID=UPI0024101601|nr:arabinogalactan protein 23-like [Prosopis cineraria]